MFKRVDPKNVDRRVINAISRLRANPALRVTDLARTEQLSRSRLEHLIRRDLDIDVRTYKRALRVAQTLEAARRILNTNAPLKAIQHDCGFHHRGNFTQCFRDIVGDTPARWRRYGTQEALAELTGRRGVIPAGAAHIDRLLFPADSNR